MTPPIDRRVKNSTCVTRRRASRPIGTPNRHDATHRQARQKQHVCHAPPGVASHRNREYAAPSSRPVTVSVPLSSAGAAPRRTSGSSIEPTDSATRGADDAAADASSTAWGGRRWHIGFTGGPLKPVASPPTGQARQKRARVTRRPEDRDAVRDVARDAGVHLVLADAGLRSRAVAVHRGRVDERVEPRGGQRMMAFMSQRGRRRCRSLAARASTLGTTPVSTIRHV